MFSGIIWKQKFEYNKELFGVIWKRIKSLGKIKDIVKVRINQIGKIEDLGEY